MVYYAKELYHSGILGQKWGQRRYQNPNGTWTEEGKRRRRADRYSDDYKKYSDLKKKSYKEMSNKDLQDFNNRSQLEQNYIRNKVGQSGIGKAMTFVAAVSGLIIAANNFSDAAERGKKILKKIVGD